HHFQCRIGRRDCGRQNRAHRHGHRWQIPIDSAKLCGFNEGCGTMNPIVECVPNFSEGRRPDVIDAITKASESVDGVFLLDRHIDPDYNRMVLTLAGSPETMAAAILTAVTAATLFIDLREQRGEHPRMGATDVVPFVPIQGVTMLDCVNLAREEGIQIAAELQIPVYLYEAAATRPERVRLENIRLATPEGRGQPDFG